MSLLLALAGAAPAGVSLSLAATEGADIASASANLVESLSLTAIEGADTSSSQVGLALSLSIAADSGFDWRAR